MAPDIFTVIPNWLPGWLGAGFAAGGGFGVIKWAMEFFAGRIDKRQAVIEAGTLSLIDNLRAEIKRMAERQESSDRRLAAAEGEIRDLRQELNDCHEKHAAAEATIMRLEAIQQGFGEARDRAQAMLAAERIADRQRRD